VLDALERWVWPIGSWLFGHRDPAPVISGS
jgi:hypothetical protein